jgi:hypothetical protein
MNRWLKDKWAWLKTFNNPPTVRVTADSIVKSDSSPVFYIRGRVRVDVEIKEVEFKLDNITEL